MKRIWASTIAVSGITVFFVALYFMFGVGENYKSLSQDDAARIMEDNPDCLVADVRSQEEYDGGHIPGAICVPIDDLREGKVDAFPDKHQIILIYCHAGRRAVEAAKILTSMGYRSVYAFGGLVDWNGPVTNPLPTADDAETFETDAAAPETEASAENAAPETEASAENAAPETEASAENAAPET